MRLRFESGERGEVEFGAVAKALEVDPVELFTRLMRFPSLAANIRVVVR